VPIVENPDETINPCQLQYEKLIVGDEFVLLTKPPRLPVVQFNIKLEVTTTYEAYTKPP